MRTNLTLAAGLLATLTVLSGAPAVDSSDRRLVDASADQDKAAIRMLLKQGANVNGARADGTTALLWAVHFNDFETADLCLKAGANPNATDDHGVTPLSEAAENTNLAMVQRLLVAGANPNTAQTNGVTPLIVATQTGNLEVVKALIGRGANVNAAVSETKSTALMWAVTGRFPDLAKALIAAHADVHASTYKGYTPLLYAAQNGDIEMAKLLLAGGVNVNESGSDGTSALPLAIFKGQMDFALFLIDQGADPNAQIGGVRALHAAAGSTDLWLRDWTRRHEGLSDYSGVAVGFSALPADPAKRVAVLKALLAKGADINGRIATSAMFMAYIGYPTKGAFEPFACGTGDVRGATPLWVAAYTANFSIGGGAGGGGGRGRDRSSGFTMEILNILLAAGADQRLTTEDGTTPLMVAAGLGRATFSPGLQRGMRSMGAEQAVKILIDAGADVNAVNEGDFTAIHGAAFRGLDEVIEYLVKHGANINARDYRGRTPYRLAEGSKQSFQFQAYPETAEFIKKLGADIALGIPGNVQERVRDVPASE